MAWPGVAMTYLLLVEYIFEAIAGDRDVVFLSTSLATALWRLHVLMVETIIPRWRAQVRAVVACVGRTLMVLSPQQQL